MTQYRRPNPLAPTPDDALREALSQLARRVRYLETLPSGAGDQTQYVKLWRTEDTQTIPHDTDTLLYFTDNELTHAAYVTELSPYLARLTVPSGLAGIHTVTAGVAFAGAVTGQRRLWIVVTDPTELTEQELVAMQVDAAGDYFTELNVSAPAWLEEGYFVSAWVWQNSGGDLAAGPA